MKVSVIIPCLNAEQTLRETLEAVTAQKWDYPWEIVVADNGSTDNSKEIVALFQQRFGNLRLVDASAHKGQPFALNTGVETTHAQSVLFCDADDVPAPGWLATMGNALETHSFIAARMDLKKLNSSLLTMSRGHHQTYKIKRIPYPPYLPHAGGGTIGVWRELFLRVGGFDESLPYLHDTDFCFKAQLAGQPLIFVPNAVISIRYRTELSKIFNQSRKWAAYNILLAKRYRNYGKVQPKPWHRLIQNSKRSLVTFMKWHRLTVAERFHSIWQIGQCLGKWEGIVKYRTYPF